MSFTSRIAAAAARGYGMFAAVARAVDPFFNYVTALLHGDGTNGAQNNTFLDSSTNNFTITRNGNTTQGTFSPFSQTGWSNYFDGATATRLTLPSNAAFAFGTGAYTVEAWVYLTAYGTQATIFDAGSASGAFDLAVLPSGALSIGAYGVGAVLSSSASAVPLNQWVYVAAVRTSTSANGTALFVNGTSVTTGTDASNWTVTTTPNIAGYNLAGYTLTGYISNLRVTKGGALYSSAFTPSTTPLTTTVSAGTVSLLTCQSNRFVDNSANAFAITATGSPSVQAFSPFNPTSAWSASSNGGSGYFDGSGDYLSIAYNSAFNFGTGDFTIECWVYPVGNQTLYTGIATQNGSTNGWYLSFGNSNAVRFTDYATAYLTSSSSVNPNSWTHVAVTRSGTAMKMFFNGVVVASTTSSATFGEAFPVVVGFNATNYFLGYITDLRLVKGTAVYTAAFTPPTAPLTAITNTSLLLNYTNAGIYDNAAVGDYETVGNAQVSTSVKKYGTGSMAFDGTGDYLSAADSQAFNFGSGDWTIEAWLYLNTAKNYNGWFGKRQTSLFGLTLQIDSSNVLSISASTTGSSWALAGASLGGGYAPGTWMHVAVTRLGNTITGWLNGTKTGTQTLSGSIFPATGYFATVGSANDTSQELNGYIDDFRITKGVARYVYNFTPPTAAFPNIGGTVTPTSDQYFNYTTLLLPGNGTNGAQNNTFLDSSSNAFTITRNGNTTQGNFSPFSQTGWGNYFGGSSDYINFASSSALSFVSDFTVEAWVYNNYSTGTFNPAVLYDSSSSAISSFEINNGTNYPSVAGITATNTVTRYTFSTGPSVPVFQWVHVAWVRSSGTVKVYVNGTASTSTLANSAATGQIVQVANGRTSGAPWNGYISNLRITSSAVYTSNFTPSSVPLTAISGTQLLTCQANRFVDASSNALSPTLIGSPTVQAFSPFAPTAAWSASVNGGSGYFDGSGDELSAASNAAFNLSTGAWTVEAWIYPTTSAGYRTIISGRSAIWEMGLTTGVYTLYFYNGSIYSTTAAVNPNSWNHVALSSDGTNIKMFVNGVLDRTVTASPGSTATATYVGSANGVQYFTGYIADARIVKGTQVYTATFTPPTAPLTAITNTSLLLSATNGGIVDATAKNDLETVGNAQISTTQSKFGGSSIYLDGTGDWLIGKSSVLASFGTGDFTIEGWVYPSAVTGTDRCLWDTRATAADTGMVVFIDTNGKISTYTSAAIRITSTNALTANTWQHFALCRYNGTMAVYINGIQNGTLAYSTTITCPGRISVGVRFDDLAPYTGYIDDFRVTPGIARYTSNFTPPTSAFLLQ